MKKRCLLWLCKDNLFKGAMSSLLLDMAAGIQLWESNSHDVETLLKETSHMDPDVIVLESTSPLSDGSLLMRVLMARPGRPVIVVSHEHNWMHVVRWETVRLESANDLIDVMKFS